MAGCYRNSLALAEQHGCKTIAFPAISTGAYGYPVQRASEIAINACRRHVAPGSRLTVIGFVCFSAEMLRFYQDLLAPPLS